METLQQPLKAHIAVKIFLLLLLLSRAAIGNHLIVVILSLLRSYNTQQKKWINGYC